MYLLFVFVSILSVLYCYLPILQYCSLHIQSVFVGFCVAHQYKDALLNMNHVPYKATLVFLALQVDKLKVIGPRWNKLVSLFLPGFLPVKEMKRHLNTLPPQEDKFV